MPYDPNFPPSHADLTSDAFRANFNGLKDLIDAVPAPLESSGANCQIQIADGNGNFASDENFYFVQGDGWTSLRCNWPTTDPGIAGALWNNNGVLNVSAG